MSLAQNRDEIKKLRFSQRKIQLKIFSTLKLRQH